MTTELTIEITDYCPHSCSFCSSNAGPHGKKFLTSMQIDEVLCGKHYDIIHISGGEPLAHPHFWSIFKQIERYCDAVVVHTNALKWISYNATVLKSGIRVDANVPLPENVNTLHVLKKVNQGRESDRPEVKYSGNWNGDCSCCGHHVLRADGVMVEGPCNKEKEVCEFRTSSGTCSCINSGHYEKPCPYEMNLECPTQNPDINNYTDIYRCAEHGPVYKPLRKSKKKRYYCPICGYPMDYEATIP